MSLTGMFRARRAAQRSTSSYAARSDDLRRIVACGRGPAGVDDHRTHGRRTAERCSPLGCMIAALVLRRASHPVPILAMVVLSVVASLRYMYWRLTSSLGFENRLNMLFGYGLVLAELYALVVLLLGYLQTAWPLQRKPYPLPADSSAWPTVDVFIPTYNEPLDIIKLTSFAAQAIDWPKDKLRVYVLDDGRRDEFLRVLRVGGYRLHHSAG